MIPARSSPSARRLKLLYPAPIQLQRSKCGMRKMSQLSFYFSREHWIQLWMLGPCQTQEVFLFYICFGLCTFFLQVGSSILYLHGVHYVFIHIFKPNWKQGYQWRVHLYLFYKSGPSARVEWIITRKDPTEAQLCLLGVLFSVGRLGLPLSCFH